MAIDSWRSVLRSKFGKIKAIYNILTGLDARLEDVESGEVAAGSIGSDELGTGAVINDKLGSNAVTAAKMLVLSSAEETATGSEQEITHALGVAPTIVAVIPTTITVDDTVDYVVTYGTHTTTKVKVTVAPAGSKFKIFAIA